jgi:hypothetical protein
MPAIADAGPDAVLVVRPQQVTVQSGGGGTFWYINLYPANVENRVSS